MFNHIDPAPLIQQKRQEGITYYLKINTYENGVKVGSRTIWPPCKVIEENDGSSPSPGLP